jgi:hypothetical protein
MGLNLEAAKAIWDIFQQLLSAQSQEEFIQEESKPFSFIIPSNNNNYGN